MWYPSIQLKGYLALFHYGDAAVDTGIMLRLNNDAHPSRRDDESVYRPDPGRRGAALRPGKHRDVRPPRKLFRFNSRPNEHTPRIQTGRCNISMLILISFHFSEAGVGQCIFRVWYYADAFGEAITG